MRTHHSSGGVTGLCVLVAGTACTVGPTDQAPVTSPATSVGPNPALPAPEKKRRSRWCRSRRRRAGRRRKPHAAPGVQVNAFASGLDHPRWLYVLPNGDVLVAETNAPPRAGGRQGHQGRGDEAVHEARRAPACPSANRITLLRDADGDGVAEIKTRVPDGPELALRHGAGRQRSLRRRTPTPCEVPYAAGRDAASPAPGTKRHGPARPATQPSLDQEHHRQPRRHEALRDRGLQQQRRRERHGRRRRPRGDLGSRPSPPAASALFATGLRNPNGMAWEPQTGALWTVVNERDELGNDLVPDYLTSVKDGAFYGWPYSYYGQHVDAAREAAAARPGGQGHRARLRAGRARRRAGPGVCRRRAPAAAIRATARSSASTARGTASRSAATRWSSCRSKAASPRVRRWMCSPASSATRAKPRAGRSASRSTRAAPAGRGRRRQHRLARRVRRAGSQAQLTQLTHQLRVGSPSLVLVVSISPCGDSRVMTVE